MLRLSPTRTIIRGDSDRFKLNFARKVDENTNIPTDITGWNIRFTVREDVPDSSIIDDTDALISEQAVIIDALNGLAEIYVQSETTTVMAPGTYLYDIQVVKPIDSMGRQEISSVRRGKYIVVGDIAREERYNTEIRPSNPSNDEDYNITDDDADDGYEI